MTKDETVAVVAEVRARPGGRDRLLAAIEQVLDSVRAEPGCVRYVVHVDDADADVVWFYECYRDAQARADHGGSGAIGELRRSLPDLIAAPPRIVAVTPVMDKERVR